MKNSKKRFKPYSLTELRKLPMPAWLVDRVLPEKGAGVLYGAAGKGKTFVTLDLALCVATGRAWHGHDTRQGTVVYVAAEGATGLRLRADVWEQTHGVRAGKFFVVREPVPLADDQAVDEFIAAINPLGVSLIVFDTLARCFGGGDENSSQDMGKVIAGVDWIRHQCRCAVLYVHHSGRNEDHERGSTALVGAVDAMFRLSSRQNVLTVECRKQKDGPDSMTLYLRLQSVETTETDDKGRPLSSCVVVAAGSQGDTAATAELVSPRERLVLGALASSSDPVDLASLQGIGLKEDARNKVLRSLREKQLIARVGKGRYALTPQGQEWSEKTGDHAGTRPAAACPPLKGGQEQHEPAA